MAVPDEAAVGDGRPVAMKKSAWTKEEDAVLREQVRLHGPRNWAAISEALLGRNPKSCRLRWCQHLSPIVDTARPFTPQEDEKIIAFYRMFPSKWATIAGQCHQEPLALRPQQGVPAAAAGGCTHPPPPRRDVGSVSFDAGGCQGVRHGHHPSAPPPAARG